MPIWPLDGHPFLTPGLTGTVLKEHTELAERVLRLRDSAGPVITLDPTADASAIADVRRFLALQVSLQAAQDPEAWLAEHVERGTETIDYRLGVVVHPVADEGVAQIIAEYASVVEEDEAWPITGGWRG